MNNPKIAIIGMACRCPGAKNVDEYWANMLNGVNSISYMKKEEDDTTVIDENRYVRASGHIDDTEWFDGHFFGYTPKESEYMDPQQRVFLETAWTALEHAGYRPQNQEETIGIFGGSSVNKYFLYNLYPRLLKSQELGGISGDEVPIGTTPDYLTSRVAYKLGFKGPAVSIQATCASSLVSVCMASQSLIDYRCDMALAGGVSIKLPNQKGYWAQKDGLFSPSGKCRPYDAQADGSIFTSGVGVVVLKRLEDAIKDRDQIYAVIRGWATNNDGSERIGFTTPGLNGQASVVVEAQIVANVEPKDIVYIEGHGSATPLGDQIEVEALKKAFRRSIGDTGYCALGSVKGNIGHTDAASGVLGLIKTALSLKHKLIPPSINFEKPHPSMEMESSPFYVNDRLYDLSEKGTVLAGINSFGLGGTNAHVILESPPIQQSGASKSYVLIPFSARTKSSLNALENQLNEKLRSNTHVADLAYTMSVGRTEFPNRKVIIASTEEIQKQRDFYTIVGSECSHQKPKITFIFTGLGDLYNGVGYELYKEEAVFRETIDLCSERLIPILGFDLRAHLYSADQDNTAGASQQNAKLDFRKMMGQSTNSTKNELLQSTIVAQPACFVFEYALAKLIMSWGVEPESLFGHSLGEYVAACLAGVFSLDDALSLVAKRAQFIEETPRGSMLAVPLSEEKLRPYLSEKVSLSAVNTDSLCILAGKEEDIEKVKSELFHKDNVVGKLLPTTHAFHSHCLKPVMKHFVDYVGSLKLLEPQIPLLSNVTGDWILGSEARNPHYWGNHLIGTVRFADAFKVINVKHENRIFLEIGPGATLTSFCNSMKDVVSNKNFWSWSTIPAHYEAKSSQQTLLEVAGRLWIAGVNMNWINFYASEDRLRVATPTYPFDRKRYWVDPLEFKESTDYQSAIPLFKSSEDQNATGDLNPILEENECAGSAAVTVPRPNIETPYVPPRSVLEQRLCDIWAELFGYESIGVNDDFFTLGGHSLLALQLSNKIYHAEKIELPLVTLLENSTVSKLCKIIELQKSYTEVPSTADDLSTNPIAENTKDESTELEHMLNNTIRISLKRDVDWDEIIADTDVIKLIPELMLALKRNYKMPFYPNEIVGDYSPRMLLKYFKTELEKYRDDLAMQKAAISINEEKRSSPNDKPIIFVLSSVRSGSTLLRVMLAGHQNLFSPPELHLLGHSDMRERERDQTSSDRDQGLIVALKELTGCSHEEAENRIARMLEENWTTSAVMNHLMELSSPKLLVDKSPGYSNQLETLKRLSRNFPKAKFIYLVRHPYSVIESVVRNRFIRLMGGGETNPFDYGEFLWTRSNSNILDFLQTLNQNQYCIVRYEDLMKQPRLYLEQMCHLMGVPFTNELLTPYQGRRMRDGLGDPNLLEHNKIDSSLGDVWRQIVLPKTLGRATRLIARELEYELP
jgi:acyl transferase domain-containing protein